MAKLTLVVAHYHESIDVCRFLLTSLDIQHGIDKSDFKVLFLNDGEEGAISREQIGEYSYEIEVRTLPHGGISAVRNYGIENADTDYIMFCDCDDGFIHNYGMHLILSAIEEKFDIFNSAFIEEAPVDGGGWKIYRRDKNQVFIHGKVYRRQFLLDSNLRFSTELHFCEDTLFNRIAFLKAEKIKYVETPIYLWAWNDKSTVRFGREDICLRKYDQIILMRTLACRQLKENGFDEEYKKSVCAAVADCYCDFQEPLFLKTEKKPLREKAEREFKKFYQEFSHDYMACDSDMIGESLLGARMRAYENGYRVEQISFKDWLKHIKNDVKA